VGDEVEVWAYHKRLQADYEQAYRTDFSDTLPDGWTVTNTTGAWRQEDSITPWRDEFVEEYSDKGRDPEWTVFNGSWDTTTNPGWLTETGAAVASIWTSTNGRLQSDFVVETKINYVSGTVQDDIFYGTNGVNVVDTTINVGFRDSDNTIFVYERIGGMWVLLGSTTAYEVLGEHTVKVIRIGAIVKVYWDDNLLGPYTLTTTSCTNDGFRFYSRANTELRVNYVRISPPFLRDYAYMSNTGGTTHVQGDIYRNPTVNLDSFTLMWHQWDAYTEGSVAADYQVRLHWDGGTAGTNYIAWRYRWDGSAYIIRLYRDSVNYVEVSMDPTEYDTTHGYTVLRMRMDVIVDTAGPTITSVFLRDTYGQVVASMTGLSINYTGARIQVRQFVLNGTEEVYTGYLEMLEYPENIVDMVEYPVFHGRIVRPLMHDSSGSLVVEAESMIMEMARRDALDTGGDRVSEVTYTDGQVIEELLTENSDSYWRWFHKWNVHTPNFPNVWAPHRKRGQSWFEFMVDFMVYLGMHMQCTPEQQLLVWEYYRDFYASDVLGIGDAVPQGIHNHQSEFSKSQLQMFDDRGIYRIDDDHTLVRANSVGMTPVDFIEDRNPVPHANAMVGPGNAGNPIVGTTRTDTSRCAYAHQDYPDQIMSTVGADNLAAANVTAYLDQVGDQILKSVAHRDQFLGCRLIGTKLWYRPMDLIEVKWGDWDPTLEDTVTPLYTAKYVVQSCHFEMHKNRVEYLLGRQQTVMEEQEEVVKVDGYGGVMSGDLLGQNNAHETQRAIGDGNL